MKPVVAGIFVGGAAKRMGGRPKGLMQTREGATIVDRWNGIFAKLGAEVVLVGSNAAYEPVGLPQLGDEPTGIGPLGGLVALLRHAGPARVLAVACDMPFVSDSLMRRLLEASPDAPIVAPRRDGHWEPLCGRYDPLAVLPAALAHVIARKHSLQSLLEEVGATELVLAQEELGQLVDWDSPQDVEG